MIASFIIRRRLTISNIARYSREKGGRKNMAMITLDYLLPHYIPGNKKKSLFKRIFRAETLLISKIHSGVKVKMLAENKFNCSLAVTRT